MPTDGYTGPGSITVVADDGFGQSAPISAAIGISAAALMRFDFDRSRILFSDVGASGVLAAYADFTDQTHVLVPLDYVHARVDDPTIATLRPDGLLLATGTGATITWRWTVHPASSVAAVAMPVFGRLWQGYAALALTELDGVLLPPPLTRG